ncbi:MAG: PrsW family intramembrane metalloprotease [Bacteroidia bacterium]
MALSIILIVFIKPTHILSDPEEVLEYAEREELDHQTFWAYFQKLKKDKFDYESIYKIHLAHQRIHQKRTLFWLTKILPEYHLDDSDDYKKLIYDTIPKNRDLGFFGMAIMHLVHYHEPDQALSFLDSLESKQKAYVNFIYSLASSNDSLKEYYLNKEIELNPFPEDAVKKLSLMYFNQRRLNEIDRMIQNTKLERFVPNGMKMYITFKSFRLLDYLYYRCVQVFKGTSVFTTICCVFILLLWFYFLYTLDVFEIEKRKWIIFTVIAGGLAGLLCTYLYSLVDLYLVDSGNEQSLFYNIFVIGGIEEGVKILPLLLLITCTKEVNEPMDYIFFAALSALGLSIQEDFMYFNSGSASHIYSRAIYTSITHICESSMIGYSLVLAKYYYKKKPILFFVGGFLVACVTHGLYDFFILNDTYHNWVIPFLILLFEAWLFAHMVNNCLNNSPFYNRNRKLKIPQLAAIVPGGLLILMTIVFLSLSVQVNEEYATEVYFSALAFYTYPLYFFSISINRIDLFPSDWEPFSFKRLFSPKVFLGGVNPRYSDLVNCNLLLMTYGKQTKTIAAQLPLKAKVISREIIDGYRGYLKIETEREIVLGRRSFSVFYLRTDEEYVPFTIESRNVSSLYVIIPSSEKPTELKKLKVDCVSVAPPSE